MSDLIAQALGDPAVGVAGTAVILAILALWFAAAWWAYGDAARRTESSLAGYIAAGWIILSTPLLLPLSLAAYVFARPQVPVADRRTRTLALQLASTPVRPSCPTCADPVDEAWRRCPTCTTWLAGPCGRCGGWSGATLEICPWCGNEGRERPFVETEAIPASARARGGRRRVAWRATGPTVPRSQRPDGVRPALAPGAPRAATQRVHS